MPESQFHLQRIETDRGRLALLTLDNGEDWSKPTVLGRHALESLDRALTTVEAEDWTALVLTGKPHVFCAGADIDEFAGITAEKASAGSRAGHELFGRLAALPFPTVAAVNGACLGGGVEIALHCRYRTISSAVRHFACPEVFLGLFPAWGGTQLVPRLVAPERAVEFVVLNPLRQNRMLDGRRAAEYGFADRLLEPVEFVDESIAFALEVAAEPLERRTPDASTLADAVRKARAQVDDQVHGAARAPYVALELVEGNVDWTLEEGYRREEEAIADLLPDDQAQASIYAFDLVERRAKKRPARTAEARPVRKIGVVGAGLMATQIATVFLRSLEVPIVLLDVASEIVDSAIAEIRDVLGADVAKGRYDESKARFLGSIVTRAHGYDAFADSDLVLEAVVEDLGVKQEVFHELRAVVEDGCLLATNTSSLSVDEIGADLGLHFFNPVPLMPLVEIVRTGATDEGALATATEVVHKARKRGVVVSDAPGFVVNRLLTRMTSVLMSAVESGNSFEETDEAVLRLGLPMAPSALLGMVGPRVANHVLLTMHDAYPDRFPVSPALAALAAGDEPTPLADNPRTVGELTDDVLEALADETYRLLEEGVVGSAKDVDTCMLLGAGFPFFLGGLTRYLDTSGVSQRVIGRPLAEVRPVVPTGRR